MEVICKRPLSGTGQTTPVPGRPLAHPWFARGIPCDREFVVLRPLGRASNTDFLTRSVWQHTMCILVTIKHNETFKIFCETVRWILAHDGGA
jgi:hypothetical protein